MRENKDELRELISGLFGTERDDVLAEIESGEKLFAKSKPPKLSAETLDAVNAKVLAALRAKSRRHTHIKWISAAAAAAVMLAAGIWMSVERQISTPSAVVNGTWANIADETVFSSTENELEDIESELLAIKLGEGYANGYEEIDEFEINYLEEETDFWKG